MARDACIGIPEIRTPRSDCPKACYDLRSWCLSGRIGRVAVHLNGIAVDHSGDTGYVGQGWGGEQAQGDGEGAHISHAAQADPDNSG